MDDRLFEDSRTGEAQPTGAWIDLSRTIRSDMPVFPGDSTTLLEHAHDPVLGTTTSTLRMSLHSGTHLDAPCHFIAGRATVTDMILETCQGPALVVDLRRQKPPLTIANADLSDFRVGDRILVLTGWQPRVGWQVSDLPFFDVSTASWLLDRGITLFGSDLPTWVTPDDPHGVDLHRLLLAAGVVLVENLDNLELLAGRRIWFQALPLRLDGADGSPVRAVGRLLEEPSSRCNLPGREL